MECALYFKDMDNKDHNNYPKKVYRVEESKMFIEILDENHIQGCSKYFSSIRARDNYINDKKEHILRINDNEVKSIQNYWQNTSK